MSERPARPATVWFRTSGGTSGCSAFGAAGGVFSWSIPCPAEVSGTAHGALRGHEGAGPQSEDRVDLPSRCRDRNSGFRPDRRDGAGVIRRGALACQRPGGDRSGPVRVCDRRGALSPRGAVGVDDPVVLPAVLDSASCGGSSAWQDHVHRVVFIVLSIAGLLIRVGCSSGDRRVRRTRQREGPSAGTDSPRGLGITIQPVRRRSS